MNLFSNIKTETIKHFKAHFLLLILLIFTACQSDDDTTTPPEYSTNGFWSVAEKGWVFEFTDGDDIFYNVNAVGCAIQDNDFIPADFYGFTINQTNENELVGTSELSDSEIKFVRLPNQNPNCLPNQVSATEDPMVNFDHFWNIFNDYYAFFETRNIDWSQYESLRDQVTDDNLYDILEELAYLLDDGHVSIYDEEIGIDIQSGDPTLLERLNVNLSGDLIIENEDDFFDLRNQKLITIITKYLGGEFEIDERDNIIWGLINDDTGYINILTMEGYGTNFSNELSTLNTVLDAIMDDLEVSGVSKLIIDIRFNDGGYDTVALNMVSRFIDQERTSYFKKARLGDTFTENKSFSVGPRGNFQFTDDIVLLTSPYTVSAAELFTLCVKDLPYVTIVGENTTGAFSTILTHVLPNGAEVGLSNEIYSDAQGIVFEVVGIGAENQENQVPFLSTSDFEEEKDSGIDHALEVLDN
ncbi:S41 family peptidase [Flavivirga amylovorans]|uniref:S41 family peptidase n=1 Tax=Flavivirga amylovorans TaxID=870486 RepID=A0ABT8X1I8_9FLAO|nr:S41 family peptidase [Flavivirga amylovorans]MDO5987813.1 S41 family peptidase [Flavivirga amylovorans]